MLQGNHLFGRVTCRKICLFVHFKCFEISEIFKYCNIRLNIWNTCIFAQAYIKTICRETRCLPCALHIRNVINFVTHLWLLQLHFFFFVVLCCRCARLFLWAYCYMTKFICFFPLPIPKLCLSCGLNSVPLPICPCYVPSSEIEKLQNVGHVLTRRLSECVCTNTMEKLKRFVVERMQMR